MFTLKNSFSFAATTLGLVVLATLAVASYQSSAVPSPSAKTGCACDTCCDNGGCCCESGVCECKDCACACCAAGNTAKSACCTAVNTAKSACCTAGNATKSDCCEKPASGRSVSAKAGCACGTCCDNGGCCCDGGVCACKECACDCCIATKGACCESNANCPKDASASAPKSACCASTGSNG